jgi:hypothetical protein
VPVPHFKVATAGVLDSANAPPFYNLPKDPAFAENYFATAGRQGGASASLCPGDSGGPVFKGPFAYGGMVVGINAYYTFSDSSGVSVANVFARIATPAVIPWMKDVWFSSHIGGVGAGRGIDPTTNFDDCAGAQTMCNVGRTGEYMTLARKCETYGGDVPPCTFDDASTYCAKADSFCAAGDEENWQLNSDKCVSLGGTSGPCNLGPRHVHLHAPPIGGGGTNGGHTGSGGGHPNSTQ